MGMYDAVWFRCPDCGGGVEFQSKAGKCVLAEFDSDQVPVDIARSVEGDIRSCHECGRAWRAEISVPIKSVAMRIVVALFACSMLAGCPQVTAEAIKACGDACKDNGGVRYVSGEHCQCTGR